MIILAKKGSHAVSEIPLGMSKRQSSKVYQGSATNWKEASPISINTKINRRVGSLWGSSRDSTQRL